MTTSSPAHPYDLLEAFALDALETEEELRVLEHIKGCLECASVTDGHLLTAAALALTAPSQTPPERVRESLLSSAELSQPEPQRVSVSQPEPQKVSVSQRRPSRGWAGIYSALGNRWTRLLAPTTALAAVAVVAVVIALNVQISGQVGEMKAENTLLRQEMGQNEATATAQLAVASDAVTQMQGNLQLLQNTLAQTDDQSLVMNSMQPDSEAWGVLVFSDDGATGMIIVSELEPLKDSYPYHVWLTQKGERTWVGGMDVDERGWGTISLDVNSPLSQFDTVQLSRAPLALASAGLVGDIVLEASLP